MARRSTPKPKARVAPLQPLWEASASKATAQMQKVPGFGYSRWLATLLAGFSLWLFVMLIRWLAVDSPARLWSQATEAASTGDWSTALRRWREINTTSAARSSSYLGEARACLALGLAAQAELSLRRAINVDPANHESWRLLLEILRVENRTLEAQRLGWDAYENVDRQGQRELLRTLTLALLAELPDELVRSTLQRWVDADNKDVDARIALWQRIAAQPRATDPDRPSLLISLEELLAQHSDHIGAREALVAALADAGEPARGHDLLDTWPKENQDARYWRLRGRWELEYDHHPEQAIRAFQIALAEIPQDWQSWYRLARALRILNRNSTSREAAEAVNRIREVLDPVTLGPQLNDVLNRLDDPAAVREVATLCNRAGLARLANTWLAEVQGNDQSPANLRDSANFARFR
jgi:thioredoxin-like negative regulator of GroEL